MKKFIPLFIVLIIGFVSCFSVIKVLGKYVPKITEGRQDSLVIPVKEESSVEDSEAQDADSDESAEPVQKYPVRIPQRCTYSKIRDILVETFDVSYDEIDQEAEALIASLSESSDCYFPLEGYIVSGKYNLTDPEHPLTELFQVSSKRIRKAVGKKNIHEYLTKASIVEMESSCGGLKNHFKAEMPKVASVIENRLNSGSRLQMDVTFQYGDNVLAPAGASDEVLAQYNTYDKDGLPIGPICSPSTDALKAVKNPESSDWFFFVFDSEGNYYYASTYEEHQVNCETAGIY